MSPSVQRRARSLASTSFVRSTSRRRPAVEAGACTVRGPSARRASVNAMLSASSGSAIEPQAVPQLRDERLRPRIDAQTLLPKRERRARPGTQKRARRQLVQERFVDDQIEAAVAARHRMADAIAFASVEEQHLIRFGDRFVLSNVPHENAAGREHQTRLARGLLVAAALARPRAGEVVNLDRRRLQQRHRDDTRHRQSFYQAARLRVFVRSSRYCPPSSPLHHARRQKRNFTANCPIRGARAERITMNDDELMLPDGFRNCA